MNKIKSKLRSSTSRSPVTDEVEKLLPNIAISLEEGESQAAIFKEMKRAGHSVGAWPSSFNHALRHFKSELDELRARIRGNGNVALSGSAAMERAPDGSGVPSEGMPTPSGTAVGEVSHAGGAQPKSNTAIPVRARPLLLLCASDTGGQGSTTLARALHALSRLASTPPVLIDANPSERQLSDYLSNAAKFPEGITSDDVPQLIEQVAGRYVIIDVGSNDKWLALTGSEGPSAIVEGFANAGYECLCFMSVTPEILGDSMKRTQIAKRFPSAKPFLVLNNWRSTSYPDGVEYGFPTVKLTWAGSYFIQCVDNSESRSLFHAIAQKDAVDTDVRHALAGWLRDFAGQLPHRERLTRAIQYLDALRASLS